MFFTEMVIDRVRDPNTRCSDATTIALVVKMITLSEVTCCQLFHFLRFLKAMETRGAHPGRLST